MLVWLEFELRIINDEDIAYDFWLYMQLVLSYIVNPLFLIDSTQQH